jgi:hypothetical protein
MSYLIICFRTINHMVVKNHLHSSSDVQEDVSSTIMQPLTFTVRSETVDSMVVFEHVLGAGDNVGRHMVLIVSSVGIGPVSCHTAQTET